MGSKVASTEGSVVLGLVWSDGINFLIARSWDAEVSEECVRLMQVNPNVFPYILTSQGLIHYHPPLSLPQVQPMRLIPL